MESLIPLITSPDSITEEPAEPLSTANPIDAIDSWHAVDEFIAESLVIPFPVVMRD
jgi:hypothetical protein